ncbi:MAG: hypothetical protein G01um1014107_126, partial [Parcubacteria group bacterium Gr01-1014_107]
ISSLKVLNTILGGGMSSRLFQKLREEMGVGYYVRSFTDEYTDHGYLAVAAGVDKRRVEEVVRAIIEEFRKLKNELVPAAELRKAKDYLIGNLYLGLETSDALAEFFGVQEALKHSLKTPGEMAREIRRVSAAGIRRVAKEIFKKDKVNLVALGSGLSHSKLKAILSKL